MLGYFLGFGHIRVRRTEGVTSGISETFIGSAKRLSGHINHLVIEYKSGKNNVTPQHNPKASIVDELKSLSNLREKGEITQEEYEKLKQRIIDQA